jgi:hypothetical protein
LPNVDMTGDAVEATASVAELFVRHDTYWL